MAATPAGAAELLDLPWETPVVDDLELSDDDDHADARSATSSRMKATPSLTRILGIEAGTHRSVVVPPPRLIAPPSQPTKWVKCRALRIHKSASALHPPTVSELLACPELKGLGKGLSSGRDESLERLASLLRWLWTLPQPPGGGYVFVAESTARPAMVACLQEALVRTEPSGSAADRCFLLAAPPSTPSLPSVDSCASMGATEATGCIQALRPFASLARWESLSSDGVAALKSASCLSSGLRGRIWALHLAGCQDCDERIGRYTCGEDANAGCNLVVGGGGIAPALGLRQRQLCMVLQQTREMCSAAEGVRPVPSVRRVRVVVPRVFEDGSRVVLCPRRPVGSVPLGSSIIPPKSPRVPPPLPSPCTDASFSSLRSSGSRTSVAGSAVDQEQPAGAVQRRLSRISHGSRSGGRATIVSDYARPVTSSDSLATAFASSGDHPVLSILSRLPEVKAGGDLSLRFLGGSQRVAVSSSRNFVFEATDGDPVLQCGRLTAPRSSAALDAYSVDFRFPLAPFQAFSVLLSSMEWGEDA
jgi:hypothetical protein